jgi:hypothetical protein
MDKPKPKLKLVGLDGNAFMILGRARLAGRKAGWPEEQTTAFTTEAMSGNYSHLLATCDKYFEVS